MTATRTPLPVTQIPAGVTVIDRTGRTSQEVAAEVMDRWLGAAAPTAAGGSTAPIAAGRVPAPTAAEIRTPRRTDT